MWCVKRVSGSQYQRATQAEQKTHVTRTISALPAMCSLMSESTCGSLPQNSEGEFTAPLTCPPMKSCDHGQPTYLGCGVPLQQGPDKVAGCLRRPCRTQTPFCTRRYMPSSSAFPSYLVTHVYDLRWEDRLLASG